MISTTGERVEPLVVHCSKCHNEWSVGWLPMPTESVVVLLKTARCPAGHHRKFMVIGPYPKPTERGAIDVWLKNGDTGTSSFTIYSVMTGDRLQGRHADIPYDPSDFGRCYRLLKVMPEWVARLPEVAAKHQEWGPFVAAWSELTALFEEEAPSGTCPKLYQRMQELRKP